MPLICYLYFYIVTVYLYRKYHLLIYNILLLILQYFIYLGNVMCLLYIFEYYSNIILPALYLYQTCNCFHQRVNKTSFYLSFVIVLVLHHFTSIVKFFFSMCLIYISELCSCQF